MTYLGDKFGTIVSNINSLMQGARNKLGPLEVGTEDLGVLKYPVDSDTLSGHFIMFHIVETTPGAGKIDSNSGAQTVAQGLSATGGLGPSKFPIAQSIGGVLFNESQPNAKQQDIVSRGRTRIAATRKILIDKGFSSSELTRLKQRSVTTETVGSIIIYMPEKISTGYAFEYQGEKLQIAAAGAGLVELTRKILDESTIIDPEQKAAFIKGISEEFGLKLGTSLIDQLGSLVGANIGARAFLDRNIRRVSNPHMQFLFRSVGQRSFEYTFHFIPQSRQETEAIDDIIRSFKFFAHPELVGGGRLHSFPAEFDIQYISREQDPKDGAFVDKENDWLNRVGRCYLKDIAVDYSGSGIFSTHKSHSAPLHSALQGDTPESQRRGGNPPTHITFTLTFSELETLNRQHILEGF